MLKITTTLRDQVVDLLKKSDLQAKEVYPVTEALLALEESNEPVKLEVNND